MIFFDFEQRLKNSKLKNQLTEVTKKYIHPFIEENKKILRIESKDSIDMVNKSVLANLIVTHESLKENLHPIFKDIFKDIYCTNNLNLTFKPDSLEGDLDFLDTDNISFMFKDTINKIIDQHNEKKLSTTVTVLSEMFPNTNVPTLSQFSLKEKKEDSGNLTYVVQNKDHGRAEVPAGAVFFDYNLALRNLYLNFFGFLLIYASKSYKEILKR